jgi:hypothetical protein
MPLFTNGTFRAPFARLFDKCAVVNAEKYD